MLQIVVSPIHVTFLSFVMELIDLFFNISFDEIGRIPEHVEFRQSESSQQGINRLLSV